MPVIVCIGDSNTHGTRPMATLDGSGRFGHDARWPSVMQAALGAGFEVINEGQPGRTTVHDDPFAGPYRNGVAVLPALLESHKPLDMVIVMLGTNDLKNCYHVSPADIALCLERMVRVIQGFGAGVDGGCPDILIVAPPPILEAGCLADMFAGGAAKSHGLAVAIKAMTDRLGVGFFDAGSVIKVSPLDGIHYEAEAQVALGHAMTAVLRDHFRK
ncbi:MAG: SGNH/GDSL hydrolase family protein [Candidatus Saccharibacteria bacterium]|nr:SGNH/GDSL hydrolase family protein [Pseudorhodobacter sp.]